MARLRSIPSDINKDTTIAGLEFWQGGVMLCVILIMTVSNVLSGFTLLKIVKSAIVIGGLYVMFLIDGFTKIDQLIYYMKSTKKETGASMSNYEEITTVLLNKKVKSVITEIIPETNFGALDPDYQEQIASDFAAMTYEMTSRDATVRYVSYSSSDPLQPFNKRLEKLSTLDVNEHVRYNYERRISLHGLIADKAVKSNYFMRVDLPTKSETEWEDVLPFGEVIGPEVIKEVQVQQLLPIPKVQRGESI